MAYKPITLSCFLFMFIEMKFIHCHSCVMFAMKSMSMCMTHGFTWCRHMALPGVATWLHLDGATWPFRVVLPCVIIFIIHAHACLPCVIHMAPHKVMTMHG